MKVLILLFACLTLVSSAFGQNPAIVWQNTIGGISSDYGESMSPTSDGGYIMGGNSYSDISGDKTENSNGQMDLWIVKVDEAGILEWENTIGGSYADFLSSIIQTSDGGYLVSAFSGSNISGDKTENSKGGTDYWILKLDESGTIVWQHTYGGNESDDSPIALQTSDGGYMVAGSSVSGISGDKTTSSNGDSDIWMIRLDTNGDIVWQKTIGGSAFDNLRSFAPTNDGGFLLNANSYSDTSGDKSEDSIGGGDYWVVKLNSEGIIQWDKTLGGTDIEYSEDAIQTMDGGYLIGGYSLSPTSGNKTENSIGGADYWVVMLDANGAIDWDKTIGGNENDKLSRVKEVINGNFLIFGESESGISGDKTDPSHGISDIWSVKLNSSGVITGQQSIGGAHYDYAEDVVLTEDGGYVVLSTSASNISGDKIQDSKGASDYWVYKMTPDALGVSENELSTSISLYPNPSTGKFVIELGKDYSEVSVQISNILGQTVSTVEIAFAKSIEQNIDGPAGIYFVNIATANGGSRTLKVIKQ